MAHEINNPITGIINYAQIIDDCWDQKDTKHGQLPEWIIQEGERIAGIVSKLLSFARSDIEKKQPVSLDELLSLVLALIGTMLKKDAIQVDLRLADDLQPVWAVQHQLHQVFLNLLSNARYALNAKFSDRNPQKRITITAKEYKAAAGPMVRIIFKDYGTGIASHDLEKVCNPFFSTKPPGDGTGLGLSISYGIIEEHGGELTIESVVGEWTRVIIDLPSYQ